MRLSHALWYRRAEILLARDTAIEVPSIMPPLDVSITRVGPDALETSTDALPQDGTSNPAFGDRLRRGHVCFIARAGGSTVHYTWLGFRAWRFPDIGVEIPLSGAEAYLYDAYTVPSWRGRRIYPAAAAVLLQHAGERGIRHVYARVDRGNDAGIAALERVGFREAVRLTSVRLFRGLGIYRARCGAESEDALGLVISRATRMRPGVLVWSQRGRSGIRLNLTTAGVHS